MVTGEKEDIKTAWLDGKKHGRSAMWLKYSMQGEKQNMEIHRDK